MPDMHLFNAIPKPNPLQPRRFISQHDVTIYTARTQYELGDGYRPIQEVTPIGFKVTFVPTINTPK